MATTQTATRTTEYRRFTKGDRLISLSARLVDAEGDPVDLTGATVTLDMSPVRSKTKKIDGAAVVIEQTDDPKTRGWVRYDWALADVDTVGSFNAWFIRSVGGKAAHHPGQGRYLVVEFVGAPT